ncbi:hypothetical protein TNCV_307651 [Trichonephila clavipes]|nr:hypothetical protein TNCV_307651 [Trichonephila clavipes]
MTAVDFLHHENPPTWAGVEPATLGANGQRQINYATQSALAELENAMENAFWVSVRNNISKRWNTTENDVSKNQSSADLQLDFRIQVF